jgi:hypothetical protein
MEKTEGLIFKSVLSNKRSMKILSRNMNNSAGLRTFSAAIAGLATSSYDNDMITGPQVKSLLGLGDPSPHQDIQSA